MRRKERKRELERRMERKRLDEEMRSFRKAGLQENPTNGLLRAVRTVLRVPIAEMAGKVGAVSSTLFDFERRELDCSITLRSEQGNEGTVVIGQRCWRVIFACQVLGRAHRAITVC